MLDTWLTDILGYPVYNSRTPPESDERSLTYAKVPVDDIATMNELNGLGFRVVDVNVQLSRDRAFPSCPTPQKWVRIARHQHHQELLEIAGSCFDNSRFHLDPLIADDDANRVKREWLLGYTNVPLSRGILRRRRGLELLVALDDETPVGFLAIGLEGTSRTVDLLGVKPSHRGRAVGTALLASFIHRHKGMCDLRAGTQISNVPALRLYERTGFRITSSAYVLHLHRGE